MNTPHSASWCAWGSLSAALATTVFLWGCGADATPSSAPARKAEPTPVATQAAQPVKPAPAVPTPAPAAPVPAPAPAPAKPAAPKADPAVLFSKFGCPLCHAPGARYHEKIQHATQRTPEELAKWIRNPEKFIPGTGMPTYATIIDEPTALLLATWLKDAGPGAPTHK
jgi:mono/diheme cytochrome c family protein